MYRKKILLIASVVIGLTLILLIKTLITLNQGAENRSNIFYAINPNKNFYWIIKNDNEIFDVKPADNNYIGGFKGEVRKFSKEFSYKPYAIKNNITSNFKNISISENPQETNYFQNHKMAYDINIDSIGKVVANVYYPDEKKGGYTFQLSRDDFNILTGIVNRSSIDNLGKKYFVDDNHSSQAIVMNAKSILNDYSKIKTDLDIQAFIMFSNLLTMKYITKLQPTNKVYKIKSSEYTKVYKPESI